MNDVMDFVAGQVDASPQTAMARAFRAAVVTDQADVRAEAERAAKLEAASEARQLAYRQTGIQPGVFSERASVIGDKQAERSDLLARAARLEQEIDGLRRSQEFDAERLQLAGELASRSAPIPGLGDLPRRVRDLDSETLIAARARSGLAKINAMVSR